MVACSSGTAALHLAFQTLKDLNGWEDQSRIVLPDFTMIACARAISLANLRPVFQDVNDDGLLDPEIQPAAGTRAVLCVHTYGRRCTYSDAAGYGHNWIEVNDASEAHGLNFQPNAINCWSFYKNKIIAGEEGGIVSFPDKEQADHAKQLRNMGFTDHHNFTHIPHGMNYRMSNSHAEIILQSLKRYDVNLSARQRVEHDYGRWCPDEWRMAPRNVPWVYDLLLPSRINNEEVVENLNARGIAARVGFKRLSLQAEYRELETPNNTTAQELSERLIYLPIEVRMSMERVQRIMNQLLQIVDAEGIKSQPGMDLDR